MAQARKTTTGEIFDVQDHGTNQRVVLIPFDHRAFGWLCQGEGCEAKDLIGRRASYDGETITMLKEDDK